MVSVIWLSLCQEVKESIILRNIFNFILQIMHKYNKYNTIKICNIHAIIVSYLKCSIVLPYILQTVVFIRRSSRNFFLPARISVVCQVVWGFLHQYKTNINKFHWLTRIVQKLSIILEKEICNMRHIYFGYLVYCYLIWLRNCKDFSELECSFP